MRRAAVPTSILHSSAVCSANPRSLAHLTLFCDFDGPIIDVSDRYYFTYQQSLVETQRIYAQQGVSLSLHTLTKPQFWQMKQERTPDVEIALRSGLYGPQAEVFLAQVQQRVNQSDLLAADQLQPGVTWSLSLLHSLGVRLVLVTLREQQQADSILHQYDLRHLFTEIWGMGNQHNTYANLSHHKTALLQQAIAQQQQQGHSTATAWMIGDTEADIIAGQATGVKTIALTCGIRSRGYLESFTPTHIHSDLLSAAHFLLGIA